MTPPDHKKKQLPLPASHRKTPHNNYHTDNSPRHHRHQRLMCKKYASNLTEYETYTCPNMLRFKTHFTSAYKHTNMLPIKPRVHELIFKSVPEPSFNNPITQSTPLFTNRLQTNVRC